jgi:DNA-directed RNA polymerase subunit L
MFTIAVQGDTHTLAALVSDYAARGGNDFASHLVPHPCKNEARIAVGAGSPSEAKVVVEQACGQILADIHALQQQLALAGAPLHRVRQHDAQIALLCPSEPLVARVWRGAPLAEPPVAT